MWVHAHESVEFSGSSAISVGWRFMCNSKFEAVLACCVYVLASKLCCLAKIDSVGVVCTFCSEPYQETLTERGLPSDLDKIGCSFAVFTVSGLHTYVVA